MVRQGLLVAAAVALCACSGPSGPKPAELPTIQRPLPVRTLWSTNVGSGERYTFFPVHVGEAVYAAARDGTVTRLAARTGEVRWRANLELQLSGGVGTDGTLVVVASEEGEVVALDAEKGAVKWRARASSEVLAPPALGGGLVLIRSMDNRLFAFGADDGQRRWVYQRAPTSLVVRAPAGITISEGMVYAGFPGGKLAALALANGALRWEATVAVPKGATELERVADVIGEPAAQGREVCAAAYRSRVSCFDALSGRPLWSREVAALSGVSLDARYAFVSDERGAVHALDRSNGQSVWKQDALAYRGLTTPLPRAEAVVVGDFEGYVHVLARESGAFLARKETDGAMLRSAPMPLGGGLVLIRSMDNRLFAFGADDGQRRWVYQRAPTSLVVRAPAGITISEGMAYAGFPGGKLAALALANGALRWEATVAVPKGATELERVADVIGAPAAQGREVCAAAYRSRVSCFDALSGRPLWSREIAALSGVSLDARYAFVSDERGAVHAFDRSNGQSVWKQDALAYRGLTTPLPRAEAVVVGDFEGYVHVLARESGAFLARKETDGAMLRAAPMPLGGSVLVQTEGGGLYAFGP